MPESGITQTNRPVRRMNSAFRRREIISAAFKCIADTGNLSLSTTELAYMVGISQPAIFRHFRSKQQLHDAILEEANSRVLDHLKVQIGQAERWNNPTQLISDLMDSLADSFVQEPGVWLTLICSRSFQSGEEEAGAPTKNAIDQLRFSLKRICSKAIDAGQLNENAQTDNLSEIMIAILFGVGQQWLNQKQNFDLKERAGLGIQVLLDGQRTGAQASPVKLSVIA